MTAEIELEPSPCARQSRVTCMQTSMGYSRNWPLVGLWLGSSCRSALRACYNSNLIFSFFSPPTFFIGLLNFGIPSFPLPLSSISRRASSFCVASR